MASGGHASVFSPAARETKPRSMGWLNAHGYNPFGELEGISRTSLKYDLENGFGISLRRQLQLAITDIALDIRDELKNDLPSIYIYIFACTLYLKFIVNCVAADAHNIYILRLQIISLGFMFDVTNMQERSKHFIFYKNQKLLEIKSFSILYDFI